MKRKRRWQEGDNIFTHEKCTVASLPGRLTKGYQLPSTWEFT